MYTDAGSHGFSDRLQVLGFAATAAADGPPALFVVPRKARMEETPKSQVDVEGRVETR